MTDDLLRKKVDGSKGKEKEKRTAMPSAASAAGLALKGHLIGERSLLL
jgi:hypothetical protein